MAIGAGRARVLAHALGGIATCAVLRHSTDILGWLTWEVSSWFGESGGAHFFSVGVSVDSGFREAVTRVLVVAVPLLLIGGTAEAMERLRRRVGPAAWALPVLVASIAGAAVWTIVGREADSLTEAQVLGASCAILCLLWIVTYWSVLAGTVRVFRRQAVEAHPAQAGIAR